MTGLLRAFLWVLGALGVVWLVLGLTMLPIMGGMMDGGMTGDGMMGGGTGADMTSSMPGLPVMMALIVVQVIAMVGLVGLFVYLVVDSLRHRRGTRGRTG